MWCSAPSMVQGMRAEVTSLWSCCECAQQLPPPICHRYLQAQCGHKSAFRGATCSRGVWNNRSAPIYNLYWSVQCASIYAQTLRTGHNLFASRPRAACPLRTCSPGRRAGKAESARCCATEGSMAKRQRRPTRTLARPQPVELARPSSSRPVPRVPGHSASARTQKPERTRAARRSGTTPYP